jgi:hypothetical protein
MKVPLLSVVVTLIVWAPTVRADAATGGPQRRTLAAWEAYVATTEARIASELASHRGFFASDFSPDRKTVREAVTRGEIVPREMSTRDESGQALQVPAGTVAHWRGAVFVRGVSLDALLHRVQHPDEGGPLPDDVVSMRVLNRAQDRLTLAMRVTRSKIVTATYDTVHLATYRRHGPTRASSASVSTKVAEVVDAGTASERVLGEGEGRGFLWRMNSYWRYEEVRGGVIVELESLTLSRSIPMGLGVVVEPIVNRIARESMIRTLSSVRRLYGSAEGVAATSPQ